MSEESRTLTAEQQKAIIKAFTSELAMLRAKAEISQGDLAAIIGVSRQTYSTFETGTKVLSWGTYLSLLLYYDYNEKTHDMLRSLGIFPDELLAVINENGRNPYETKAFLPGIPDDITEKLDAQALQAIRTVIMLEYARCENISGEAVVKSFDGITFGRIESNEKAANALKAIKERRKK